MNLINMFKKMGGCFFQNFIYNITAAKVFKNIFLKWNGEISLIVGLYLASSLYWYLFIWSGSKLFFNLFTAQSTNSYYDIFLIVSRCSIIFCFNTLLSVCFRLHLLGESISWHNVSKITSYLYIKLIFTYIVIIVTHWYKITVSKDESRIY